MEKWFQKSYRRNLVDMHIEDWHEEFLSEFDPGTYYENLKKAHIQSPMLYMQSHVGYCNWPTKSGHMHNAFQGRESAMRDLFDLCHQGGMDVIAYYSLIYNNWAYDTHPEWRILDCSGKGSRTGGARYGLCCPNNKDYRAFVMTQIQEFCDYFDFEGVFFDMTFWPNICYCDSCRARWAEETGSEMPSPDEIKSSHWALFQKKRSEWIGEFAELATKEVKKYKPHCTVEHQNSTSLLNYFLGVNENISKASDYAGGDLYGGVEEQSFACKMYYNLSQNQPFEYMTSRCYPSLGEHTTTKSFDMLLQSVLMTYAHHGASLLIDAIDPVGTMDGRVYERIGEVFDRAGKFEPFLEGDFIQDVGVYYNLNAKMEVEHEGILGFSGETRGFQTHHKAALGAAKVLRENHIPFGVVNNWKLGLLEKLKVLVLSDCPFMEDRELHAIRGFVAKGGCLYLSGRSAPALVEEFFGVKCEGLTQENITYMSPTAAGKDLMPQFTYRYPMTVSEKQAILSGSGNGEVLATMTLPYTAPPASMALFAVPANQDKTFENNGLPRFASIHSNPPGRFTRLPSIMRTAFGAGKVIWSAAPFEAAMREQHSAIFASMIRELGGSFSFNSNAPDVVELVMFSVPEKNRQIISLIDVQERYSAIPIHDFDVFIQAETNPLKVMTLPDGKEIPYQYANGEIILHIDSLSLFEMIAVDY